MRTIGAFCLLLLTLCFSSLSMGAETGCQAGFKIGLEGRQGNDAISERVSYFFRNSVPNGKSRYPDPSFTQVNEFYTAIESPECRLDDGSAYENAFLDGLGQAFESDWAGSLTKIKAMRAAFPEAAWTVVAEGEYWYSYGWNIRGEGYASTVGQDSWKPFREAMQNAKKVLLDNKAIGSKNPSWYSLMIFIHTALGDPDQERANTFIEGANRFRTFFPIYASMRNALEPKWGGSWEAVEKFINWSVENTKASEGQLFYAWLYNNTHYAWDWKHDFFKESRVKWPRMKKAYEEILARWPNSQHHVNRFASWACEAGDKATFLRLRKRIGSNVLRHAWGLHPALEFCDAKYGYNG